MTLEPKRYEFDTDHSRMTIILPRYTDEEMQRWHDGAYWPRELEARGTIEPPEAERMVREARVRRGVRRARERMRQRGRA